MDNTRAQLLLADFLLAEFGSARAEEAVLLLTQAADGGEVDAAVFLHRMYLASGGNEQRATKYGEMAQKLGYEFEK